MEYFHWNSKKIIRFSLARIYIIDYYKQQHYQRSMPLFSGNFYVVFYHQTALRYTNDAHVWQNVVLSNDFSQKRLSKVKPNVLMNRKLVTKNIADFAIFCCSLCESRKWEIKIKALNIVMREKNLFIKIDIQLSRTFDSLRHLIDKAGSIA